MIVCSLADVERYFNIHPQLKKLIEYLNNHDLLNLPIGRIELDGNRLFINNSLSELVPQQKQKLEIHKRYFDVHIPLDGPETIGWSPISSLNLTEQEFNEDADFALYEGQAQSYFQIVPGQCFFAFPEDAHAPIIGKGSLRKAVCKVLIS